jgi:hypothetical protein
MHDGLRTVCSQSGLSAARGAIDSLAPLTHWVLECIHILKADHDGTSDNAPPVVPLGVLMVAGWWQDIQVQRDSANRSQRLCEQSGTNADKLKTSLRTYSKSVVGWVVRYIW